MNSYNTFSELRDLVSHMENFSLCVRGGLYKPADPDYKELADELMRLTDQIKGFMRKKAETTPASERY